MDLAPFPAALVARGLSSALAQRLDAYVAGIEALGMLDRAALAPHFSEEETEAIWRARSRRPLPESTVRQLLEECHFRCCACWKSEAPAGIVIHHIEEHATTLNDRLENLVVLCPDHHAQAHMRSTISRAPCSPAYLRMRKRDFVAALAQWKAGRRVCPGEERGGGIPAMPPSAPDHFVGRQESLAELVQELTQGNRRIALVGMGGVGKTALVLKVAGVVGNGYPGGTFWADLLGSADGVRRMLRGWIRSLGGDGDELEQDEQITLLGELLSTRAAQAGAMLLVLDDANEGLLPDLRLLVGRIPQTSGMIITTREATIPVALGFTTANIGPLGRGDARTLLRAVAGGEVLDRDTDAVDALLEIIGDLPLATELVGRQVALRAPKPGFSLGALCEQLRTFDPVLLSFPGHRGIAASFALSYDGLVAGEQEGFRALGAFALDDFHTPAVAAVAGHPVPATEQLLDRLVIVSMLGWGTTPGAYRMHPLLHQYAGFLLEKGAESERIACLKRHALHYASVAKTSAAGRPEDLAAIDRAFANISAALLRGGIHAEHDAIGLTMMSLWSASYFTIRNLEVEAIPLLDAAIASTHLLGSQTRKSALISFLGIVHSRTGEVAKALACFRTAIGITRVEGDKYDLASHLHNLGSMLLDEGNDVREALRVLKESMALARESKNADAAIGAMSALGAFYRRSGEPREAAKYYAAALEVARETGNRLSEGNNLSNLGLATYESGSSGAGERMVRDAIAIAREIGDARGEGNRTGHLGNMLAARADQATGPERQRLLSEAIPLFKTALAAAEATRDPYKQASWAMNLGKGTLLLGDPAGLGLLSHAADLAESHGFAFIAGQANAMLGSHFLQSGDRVSAQVHLWKAANFLREIGSPMLPAIEAMLGSLGPPR